MYKIGCFFTEFAVSCAYAVTWLTSRGGGYWSPRVDDGEHADGRPQS